MRKFLKTLMGIFIAFIVLLTLMYYMQEKLIFLPETLSQEYVFEFETPFEEITLEAKDGAQLNGLFFSAENPKGTILYFHGNAGSLKRWGMITERFTTYHYNVLVMDYRTYGKSTGTLSEANLYNDAQLFYDYLVTLGVSENDIVVYGRSLGTTFASFVAAKNNPRQVILETPFYSLLEVAQSRFPFLPISYLLKYNFLSYEYINDVSCPVTIFHGTADNVVPYDSGKRLYNAVQVSEKEFITIDGGGHNNLIEYPIYNAKISELLE